MECQPRLSSRFFAKRTKEGPPCPPCNQKKPAPKLPLTARQYREKECCPCDYWLERKEIEDEPQPKVTCKVYKIPPCPPNTQRTINQCPPPKRKECPKGDWDNPEKSPK